MKNLILEQSTEKGILNKFTSFVKALRQPMECKFITATVPVPPIVHLPPTKIQEYPNSQLSAVLRKNLGMNEQQTQQLERVLALIGEK